MTKLRKKSPIFVGVGIMILTLLLSFLGVGAVYLLDKLLPGFLATGDYPVQLVAELVMLAGLVLVTLALGMEHVLAERGKGFFRSMAPAGVILGYYTFAGLSSLIYCMYDPVQDPATIICFVLCMGAVGITEELAFRGLVTRMIYDKYGSSRAGVWLTVVVSGILFGCMHLMNAIGGGIALSGVLVQVICAAAVGMCLSAVYLRGGNLWSVAAIHGFMDFCALIPTGIFQGGSFTEVLGSYDATMLVGSLFYFAIAAFLLRKSKIKTLTTGENSSAGTRVKLGISVLLLVLMAAVVFLLTV